MYVGKFCFDRNYVIMFFFSLQSGILLGMRASIQASHSCSPADTIIHAMEDAEVLVVENMEAVEENAGNCESCVWEC